MVDGGLKLLAAKPQKISVVEAPVVMTKLKRRRRENEEITASFRKTKKRKPEFMSHVEVPRSVTHSNTPDASIPSSETSISPEDTASVVGKGSQASQIQSLQTDKPLQKIIASQTARVIPMEKESVMDGGKELTTSEIEATRKVLERAFNFEILLKHQEIRFIEQELAKGRIEYEQLRRCRLIPFPQPAATIGLMRKKPGSNAQGGQSQILAQSQSLAPPPGVVDGPYTRHYAQWLLPDPKFDAPENTSKTSKRTLKKAASSKQTSGVAGSSTSTTATAFRGQRSSNTSRLQSLPATHGGPKDNKEQLIIRRPSDGQWLRIECPYDGQMKFGNMQGFINHCRIRHDRHFSTHEEASRACGHAVQLDDSGAVIEGTSSDITHANDTSLSHEDAVPTLPPTTSSTASTNKRKRTSSYARDVDEGSNDRDSQNQHTSTSAPENVPSMLPSQTSSTNPTFIPSPLTPNLSALFAKRGTDGDLKQMVDEAKTKVVETAPEVDRSEKRKPTSRRRLGLDGTDEYEGEDGETENESEPEASKYGSLTPQGLVRGGHLSQAIVSPATLDRPSGDKGLNMQARRPGKLNTSIPHSGHASRPLNLSPNTIESNPAPSLVSDDGDYEDAHESEAPSSAGEENDEDGYMDVEVENEICGSAADPELAAASKARPATRKESALRRQSTRRVSFAKVAE